MDFYWSHQSTIYMSNVSSLPKSLLKAQLEQLAKEIEEKAKTPQTRHPQRWRGRALSEWHWPHKGPFIAALFISQSWWSDLHPSLLADMALLLDKWNNGHEWPLAVAWGHLAAYEWPPFHVPGSWFFIQRITGGQNVEKSISLILCPITINEKWSNILNVYRVINFSNPTTLNIIIVHV